MWCHVRFSILFFLSSKTRVHVVVSVDDEGIPASTAIHPVSEDGVRFASHDPPCPSRSRFFSICPRPQ